LIFLFLHSTYGCVLVYHVERNETIKNKIQTRCEQIADKILKVNADVVMVQEMDRSHFPMLLKRLGKVYDGRIKGGKPSWTNATFFRKSFKCVFEDSRGARSFALGIRRKKKWEEEEEEEEPILVFVNVHLEGDPAKAIARIRQLEKQFKRLETRHNVVPGLMRLVVAGDFNSRLNNATGVFARTGRIKKHGEKAFDGKTVIRTESRHSWKLKSVLRSDTPTPTYLGWRACTDVAKARLARPIDHILFCSKTFELKEIRNPLTLDTDILKTFLETNGLPNRTFPSDHVPIAALLRYRDINEEVVLLQRKRKVDEDVCKILSGQEREMLRDLILGIPKWTHRGRPSQEWIVFAKSHQKRIKMFAEKYEMNKTKQRIKYFRGLCKEFRNTSADSVEMISLRRVVSAAPRIEALGDVVAELMPPELRKHLSREGLSLFVRSSDTVLSKLTKKRACTNKRNINTKPPIRSQRQISAPARL